MLRDLSYRYKVPLVFTAVVVLSVGGLSAVAAGRAYREARVELLRGARQLGAVLAEAVGPQLRNDAVWDAYRIVEDAFAKGETAARQPLLVVVDPDREVFVSTEPERFPVLGPVNDRALGAVLDASVASGEPYEREAAGRVLLAVPLVESGTRTGTLLMAYRVEALLPGLYRTIGSSVAVGLALLVLVLPAAWYGGRRLAEPLAYLASCMERLPAGGPTPVDLARFRGADELGQLARRFQGMVAELEEKRAVERRMVAADRLAAVGRLAAGVAHEINNPLAGMLTAVDTYRRTAEPDRRTRKTMSLLERGLHQIRDTVSALLVEARLETRALEPSDLDDLRTLVAPDAEGKGVRLEWNGGLDRPVALPATQVRQAVLNLLLNAVDACPAGGAVRCSVGLDGLVLRVAVENDGPGIPPDQMERLFEPFAGTRQGGSGLGLWVTYQIAGQLGGGIEVESEPGRTCFALVLSAGEEAGDV